VTPEVLSLYRTAPATVRAHVWGRWATCPFVRTARSVPSQGRVLEVGCGYGLFSLYLALCERRRLVVGVDVDGRKIVHAKVAAERARGLGATCDFDVRPPGEVPDGPWDAVVIVDVLYLLDAAAQANLLRTCARRLGPGGVLVVKEMAMSPRWKATWNRAQETLAVRVLRITAGERLTFLDPAVLGGWMEADGLAVRHESLGRGYPHPHHLVVGSPRHAS
jgi:2-polyprenyl-3-methyl-5-hydroxy-6-metoxy-1,4-benzoquinol methylase